MSVEVVKDGMAYRILVDDKKGAPLTLKELALLHKLIGEALRGSKEEKEKP